jgi:hypothetical protein
MLETDGRPRASASDRTQADGHPWASQWTDGQPWTSPEMDGLPRHSVLEKSFEAMTLNPRTPELDGELQAVFENTHRFPTARKPIDSLRQMDTQTSAATFHDWFSLLYGLVTGQLVKTMLSVLKDRVHLNDLPVFLPRKKEGIGGHGLQCVMSWDGRRTLDESVWKEGCLGGAVCLGKLLSEDMEGALSRGGPLAGGKGSSCGNKSPEVRMRGQGCQDWSR